VHAGREMQRSRHPLGLAWRADRDNDALIGLSDFQPPSWFIKRSLHLNRAFDCFASPDPARPQQIMGRLYFCGMTTRNRW